MNDFEKTLKKYRTLNSLAKRGSIVLFGSDYLAEVPVDELASDLGAGMHIYNRSIKGLCFGNVKEAVDVCVGELSPRKLFIGLGENDTALSVKEFATEYEWLLYTLHIKCSCAIYILSVPDEVPNAAQLNDELKRLAKCHNCVYINTRQLPADRFSAAGIYKKIKPYTYSTPFTFADAVAMYV